MACRLYWKYRLRQFCPGVVGVGVVVRRGLGGVVMVAVELTACKYTANTTLYAVVFSMVSTLQSFIPI